MTIATITRAEDLLIDVPVTLDDGHPWGTLEGVTFEAWLGQRGDLRQATVTVSGETLRLTVARWSLTPGVWTLEVLGTKSGLTQALTLADATVAVTASIRRQA